MRRMDKSEVMADIEPTGYCWFEPDAYLENDGTLLVMVNLYEVKQTKVLDDNSQNKNDRKNSKVIDKLVAKGLYSLHIHQKVCMQT